MTHSSVPIRVLGCASLLVIALLACCQPYLVRGGTATVTVTFPNSSYPALGELMQLFITYNDTADPHPELSTYPLGHVITAMSGFRSVWQATADGPTTYSLHSTATVLGVVPLFDPIYWMYDATLNTVVPYTGSLPPPDGSTEYGSRVTYAFYNGTNFTSVDGIQLYPTYFIVYNNFYYPTGVADRMDYGGWMLWLDRYQPGNLNISMNSGYSQYKYAVNLFSGGTVSASGDITDVQPYPPNYGSLYPDGLGGGFDGTIIATTAAVRGDPQFTGLRGQSYQVHGIDGGVYSFISDRLVQVNGRFTFISEQDEHECLIDPATQKPWYVCWTHPGSYISALALQTNSHSQMLVEAGQAQQGFSSVLVDGAALRIGDNTTLHFASDSGKARLTGAIVSRRDLRTLTIEHAGVYSIQIQNSAGFLNIVELAVDSWNLLTSDVKSHGLLGQTWRRYSQGEDVKDIEGRIDDYLLTSGDLFQCDDLFSQFKC